jgi:hypothetical protein
MNKTDEESMPTFNTPVEGSQPVSQNSMEGSLSPIETEQSVEEPTTAVEEPTTAVEEPTTAVEEPTTAAEEPTTAAEEPTTAVEEPTATAEEPTTTAAEEPTATAEEAAPSEEGEPLEEPVVSESKQMDKDKKTVDEAATFRKKLTNTKKRLPTMDDHQKDEIRNGVITEFINILKISKRATTRKKLGRRINNLRGVFNETLDMLNGTAKKRAKKRKTKKQQGMMSEAPPAESFSENQS